MKNQKLFNIIVAVALALALVLSGYAALAGGNAATARGTTSSDWNVGGNLAVTGTSSFTDDLGNTLTVCDATAADCKIQYDGNAQDFYAAIDDSADDFLLGLGSTVGTTGIVYLDENQDVGLGGASAGAKLDITGNQLVDGAADEVQLTIQGFTTQTNNTFVVETSAGTDLFWVTNDGDAELNGTTPALTIGDAGAEDTAVIFDGNAQDFYACLDDSADDLVIGLGSACGTTPGISIDESQNTDVAGTLQYGANNLYPVGYASSGQQLIYGTSQVTGTAVAAHGLTTVTWALCQLGEAPTAGAGDAYLCWPSISANVVTLTLIQDDATAATEADVTVYWLVVGAP